jgi:excisionase family DNA binding protein
LSIGGSTPRQRTDEERLDPLTVRIRRAVELTGISRSKLYELIKAGEIETVKIGATTLIPFASLRDFMERQKSPNSDS